MAAKPKTHPMTTRSSDQEDMQYFESIQSPTLPPKTMNANRSATVELSGQASSNSQTKNNDKQIGKDTQNDHQNDKTNKTSQNGRESTPQSNEKSEQTDKTSQNGRESTPQSDEQNKQTNETSQMGQLNTDRQLSEGSIIAISQISQPQPSSIPDLDTNTQNNGATNPGQEPTLANIMGVLTTLSGGMTTVSSQIKSMELKTDITSKKVDMFQHDLQQKGKQIKNMEDNYEDLRKRMDIFSERVSSMQANLTNITKQSTKQTAITNQNTSNGQFQYGNNQTSTTTPQQTVPFTETTTNSPLAYNGTAFDYQDQTMHSNYSEHNSLSQGQTLEQQTSGNSFIIQNDKIKMDPPPYFNGDFTENAKEWLRDLEFYNDCQNHITEITKAKVLRSRLQENAKEWCAELPENVQTSFTLLKQAFIRDFIMMADSYVETIDLKYLKVRTLQEFDKFIQMHRKQCALSKLTTFEQKLYSLYNNLPAHITADLKMNGGPKSMPEAYQSARYKFIAHGGFKNITVNAISDSTQNQNDTIGQNAYNAKTYNKPNKPYCKHCRTNTHWTSNCRRVNTKTQDQRYANNTHNVPLNH